jgi:hypothetical protein
LPTVDRIFNIYIFSAYPAYRLPDGRQGRQAVGKHLFHYFPSTHHRKKKEGMMVTTPTVARVIIFLHLSITHPVIA